MINHPIIGITAERADARWHVWHEQAAVLAVTYLDAVFAAGGLPVLLPPLAFGAPVVLNQISALIVSGGTDVCPSRYGAARHPATQPSVPERDDWELTLIRLALDRDLPVLGICRGMQLLNVACGGTLVQHLPDLVGHHEHAPGPGRMGQHSVRVKQHSQLSTVFGDGFDAPSYHHQSIEALGSGIAAVGWAADQVIEAVEMPGKRFVVGIQGHPEAGGDARIFQALVDAARGHDPELSA